MRRSLLVLAAVVVVAACSDPPDVDPTIPTLPPGSTVSPGDTESAPDFDVPTDDGGTFRLSDHLARDGRPVLLNLWASWCHPCREEMPAIDAAAKRHPGVHFLGVSVQDGESDARAFADEIGVSYQLGFDIEDEVDRGYAPLGLPATYIISGDGVLLERFFGVVTEELIDQKIATWFGG